MTRGSPERAFWHICVHVVKTATAKNKKTFEIYITGHYIRQQVNFEFQVQATIYRRPYNFGQYNKIASVIGRHHGKTFLGAGVINSFFKL